jgi:hypothetical protein
MMDNIAGFVEWLQKKVNDVASFIDESFLANFLSIFGGLSQTSLCTFLIHYRYSI